MKIAQTYKNESVRALILGCLVFGLLVGGQTFAAESQREAGGKMTFSSLKAIHSYEPIVGSNLASVQLSSLMFEGLVSRDPFEVGVIPRLAERFESSKDQIVFHLKPNVKWHDGEPLTADDVLFTYQLIMNPQTHTALGQNFEFIKSVTLIDDYTIIFNFKYPIYKPELRFTALSILPSHLFSTVQPYVPGSNLNIGTSRKTMYPDLKVRKMASPNAQVVYTLPLGCLVQVTAVENEWIYVTVKAKGDVGKQGWIQKYRPVLTKRDDFVVNPIGTGFYKFKTVDFKGDVLLERNQAYHGQPANISIITRHMLTDKQTMINDINVGYIDLIPETPIDQVATLAPNDVNKIDYPSLSFTGIMFNCRKFPLNDKRVRQALALALNREKLFTDYYLGKGNLLSGPFSYDSWGINLNLPPLRYDSNAAQAAINQALGGKTITQPLELAIKTDENSVVFDIAISFVDAMKKIGVPVNMQKYDRRKWETKLEDGDFDMAYVQWVFDIGYNIYSLFHSQGKLNYGGYHNPPVDQLLDDMLKTSDADVILEQASKTQEYLYDDCPYIFLWTLDNVAAVHNRISGIDSHTISPFSFFDFIDKWWIEVGQQ